MIYIELMGGLGNQLFQIFCGIAYSLEHKIAFKINCEKPDKVSPLDYVSRRPTYFDNFLKNLSTFLYNGNISVPIFRERTFFVYNKIPKIELDFFKLWGYYQSYKYFDNQYDKIVRLIGLDQQKISIKSEFSQYFNSKTPISLHFRIGDYVKNPKMHPVLPINYYINAIKYMKNTISNFEEKYYILYFGELTDINKINNHIITLKSEFPDLEIHECSYNIEDWKQMLLMSLCNHNIIANSSFSWWGAYFNDNPEKIVCYPSIWNGSTNNTDDLFPDFWKLINI